MNFNIGNTYYSSKIEWANAVNSTTDRFWSQYHQQGDFMWCSTHHKFFIPIEDPSVETEECKVCRKHDKFLNITGVFDQKAIEGVRDIWVKSSERLQKVSAHVSSTQSRSTGNISFMARDEVGSWLMYEISIWNLGQALKSAYMQDHLRNGEATESKSWKMNPLISQYYTDRLVRISNTSAPMGTSLKKEDPAIRSLLDTPGLTFCVKHEAVGEGIPFKAPNRYNPECFICIKPRKQTEESKQRDVLYQNSRNSSRTTRDTTSKGPVQLIASVSHFKDESLPSKNNRPVQTIREDALERNYNNNRFITYGNNNNNNNNNTSKNIDMNMDGEHSTTNLNSTYSSGHRNLSKIYNPNTNNTMQTNNPMMDSNNSRYNFSMPAKNNVHNNNTNNSMVDVSTDNKGIGLPMKKNVSVKRMTPGQFRF
jgi:hypothetical protein